MSINGLGGLLAAIKDRMIEDGFSETEAERFRLDQLRGAALMLPFIGDRKRRELVRAIDERVANLGN